jgi:hypothetical protein
MIRCSNTVIIVLIVCLAFYFIIAKVLDYRLEKIKSETERQLQGVLFDHGYLERHHGHLEKLLEAIEHKKGL